MYVTIPVDKLIKTFWKSKNEFITQILKNDSELTRDDELVLKSNRMVIPSDLQNHVIPIDLQNPVVPSAH